MAPTSQPTENKLFGKFHELSLLLIAFFLSTVCGGALGYYFQNRNWEKQYQAGILQSEKESAEKVFSEVSQLVDSRMYKMRKILWGYKYKLDQNELKDRWIGYENILDLWNTNLNKNHALIQRYFGDNARNIFHQNIHNKFRELGTRMEKYRKIGTMPANEITQLLDEIDELNNIFYVYDLQLLYSIRDENIGKFLTKELRLQ